MFYLKLEPMEKVHVAVNLVLSIGHYRVLLCLCSKMSLSANLSYENEFCIPGSACSFIFKQIKVIFIRMVSHLDSL